MSSSVLPSEDFIFRVTKGSQALGVKKGQSFRATFRVAALGEDTAILLETTSKLANGRRLYLSGNRRYVPELRVLKVFNLHDGNPLHNIKIEIRSIELRGLGRFGVGP